MDMEAWDKLRCGSGECKCKYCFDRCDCYWADDGGIRKCGCDDPGCVCRLYRSSVVIHWLGEHWNISCAMYQAAKILNQLERDRENDNELGGVDKTPK